MLSISLVRYVWTVVWVFCLDNAEPDLKSAFECSIKKTKTQTFNDQKNKTVSSSWILLQINSPPFLLVQQNVLKSELMSRGRHKLLQVEKVVCVKWPKPQKQNDQHPPKSIFHCNRLTEKSTGQIENNIFSSFLQLLSCFWLKHLS